MENNLGMFEASVLNCGHGDLIHDVSFDWYGRYMATCSSDQTVKVWKLEDKGETEEGNNGNKWKLSASWKCHSGSVWKVNWAHPEFGRLLATCSFDRTASIWEERPFTNNSSNNKTPESAEGLEWVKRTSLVDSRTSVTDVKFGPKQMGLVLATCSADGTVRIYEATDVMNLSQWSLQHEIPCKLPASCISFNHSLRRSQAPMIAVGSDDVGALNGAKVFLYEYVESSRRWQRVDSFPDLKEPVHDLAFAPSVGRSYSVLAVASKDLKIITLKCLSQNSGSDNRERGGTQQQVEAPSKYEVRMAGQFNEHNSPVWRLCWDVTGTSLASSGDDGVVKIWKSNYRDEWKCIAQLRGDGASDQSHFNRGMP